MSPRADRRSSEPVNGADGVYEAGEMNSAAIAANGEAAEVLEAAEASFDRVAMLVAGVIENVFASVR